MPRDGARVRRCSKKASAKRSTIKCVRHPGRKSRATNQSHNSPKFAAVFQAARARANPAYETPAALRRCRREYLDVDHVFPVLHAQVVQGEIGPMPALLMRTSSWP